MIDLDITTDVEEQADICAYKIDGAPHMYFGELYYDEEDKERNKLVFKKALILELDVKTKTSKWMRVPTAGKESLVVIDTRFLRGILVKNIDQNDAASYKEASLKLYSSLHLA